MVLVVLFATPAAAADTSIEGHWYGENCQPALKTTAQELIYHRPDGTFDVEFRRYENCVLKLSQTEQGTWSLEDKLLHMQTDFVNGAPTHYEDDYEIQSFDGKTLIYRHTEDGQVFTETRVTPSFVIPECRIS
ncbi:MAG TPA: hypothetical protein VHT04_01200 [Stellaceae bacterium]|nr:hypothetical protein [Stellaceae bacterium]